MRLKLAASLLIMYFIIGGVLAYDRICDFNGSVRLNKSDLLPYVSDQSGCALQKMQDGSGLLLIVLFVALILLFIYGLSRRRG